MGCNSTHLKVTVIDDGEGFLPNHLRDGASGLAGMRERALLAGGHLEVVSTPGGGTTLQLTVRARGTRAP
jgi:signal transduction histidine kinase